VESEGSDESDHNQKPIKMNPKDIRAKSNLNPHSNNINNNKQVKIQSNPNPVKK